MAGLYLIFMELGMKNTPPAKGCFFEKKGENDESFIDYDYMG